MKIELLQKKNYLAMIRNAAKGENHLFRNFFISIDGHERDALRDGALGCGVFVSSVLYLQNSSLEFMKKSKWIEYVHANVGPTEEDMERNGWHHHLDELREGAVISWVARVGDDGTEHRHIGFYIGGDRAASNGSNTTHMPIEHHVTYDGTRKIDRIWWHPALNE